MNESFHLHRQSPEPTEPLLELAGLLCDDALSAEESRRLAELLNGSAEARTRFVEYLHLHGELYWSKATFGGEARPRSAVVSSFPAESEKGGLAAQASPLHTTPAANLQGRPRIQPIVVLWIAVGLMIAVGGLLLWQSIDLRRGNVGGHQELAIRLTGSFGAVWADSEVAVGRNISPDQPFALVSGVVRLESSTGTTCTVEGPSRFIFRAADHLVLQDGSVAVEVGPDQKGFVVETPEALIRDRGTRFGVLVGFEHRTEVHVFSGEVVVESTRRTDGQRLVLHSGQAIAWASGEARPFSELPRTEAAAERFALALPAESRGSISRLRQVVQNDPRVFHHYSFEGFDEVERLRDERGSLHLHRIVMSNGDGRGRLQTGVRGWDATSRAVHTFRASADGNRSGVGMVSESSFAPPPRLTIELLARFDSQQREPGAIYSIVATRTDRRACSFFLAAVDDGRLALLFDADAGWVTPQNKTTLRPLIGTRGNWHYLALTAAEEGDGVRVSVYCADLTRGDRQLSCLIDSVNVPGRLAVGPLAVGCGFADDLTHAYPWAGAIDELAIYNDVLDQSELQKHVDLLWTSAND